MVHDTSRGTDHDMDAVVECTQLAVNRLAAIHRQYHDTGNVGEEVRELFCNLDSEFAGWAEHDCLYNTF